MQPALINFLNADVRLDGADIGMVNVDPMVYSIMVGKRF